MPDILPPTAPPSRAPLARLHDTRAPGRRVKRGLVRLAAGLALLALAWAALYRVVDPPTTPLMLLRLLAGGPPPRHEPVPLAAIAPSLIDSVIAAEDARFCRHHGIDWQAVDAAWEADEEGKRLRGGSTISQQTAKNAFLWPGRDWLRKGVEAPLTLVIEALWGKRRILEVYLGMVEWGDGIYGAQAAAQAYFGVPASRLDPRQSAALAAVLPAPRRWRADHPGPYVARRLDTILARARDVARDGLDDCVRAR